MGREIPGPTGQGGKDQQIYNQETAEGMFPHGRENVVFVAGGTEEVPERRRSKGLRVSYANRNLYNRVIQKRKDGENNKQIAAQEGMNVSSIDKITTRLIKAGIIERIRRRGPMAGGSRDKFFVLLRVFQETYPLGAINLSEIASQLEVSREWARQLYGELSEKNPPPILGRREEQLSPEYLTALDDAVAHLSNQGMEPKQIAEELHVKLVWVKASQERFNSEKRSVQGG